MNTIETEEEMISREVLAERWPAVFGPDGLVVPGEYEELIETAYSVEFTGTGLRIGFAFSYDELDKAFECGADVVGRLAPDNCEVTILNMDDGCIVYAEVSWEIEDA